MTAIRPLQLHDESAFTAAAQRSIELHDRWVSPPMTTEGFRELYLQSRQDNQLSFVILTPAGELAGIVNVSQIVRQSFQSAYLGYYGFAPHQRQGHMRVGLAAVITTLFTDEGLHRLEANIQPNNTASIALVRSLGFRLEGFSSHYLHIDGAWRDHERYAVTAEEWQCQPTLI